MKQKTKEKIALKVLYLEDSPRDIEIIRELLIEAKFDLNMEYVETKKEYTSRIRKDTYDLILSDFSLPGFDAFGALQLHDEICPEVPFICVSGSIGEEVAIELIKKGAADYVLKDRLVKLPVAIKRVLNELKEKKLRKQVEEKLKETEQRYSLLFNSSMDAILLTSPEGRIFSANPAACEMFGRTEEEICSLGRSGVVDNSDPNVMAAIKERNRTGRFSGELQLLRKDGSKFMAEVTSAVFNDKEGRQRSSMIIRDITERKRTENALRESEERVTKAFHSIPDAIVISRMKDGKIIEINDSWCKMFGYSREEVIEKSSIDLNLFADSADRRRAIALLGEKGLLHDFKLKIRQKSGALREAVLTAELLKVQHEQYMLTVIQDVTEQKRAERELLKREDQLQEAQRIGRIGSWEWDVVANKSTCSDELYRIFGRDRNSFRFTLEDFLNLPHPDDREMVGRMVRTGFEKLQAADFDFRITGVDGDIRWIHSKSKLLLDENGKLQRVFGTAQDITERKRAEDALKESEEKFRAIFDNATDGIFLIDPLTRKFFMCNTSFVNMLGFTKEELLAMDIADLHRKVDLPFIYEQIEKFNKGLEGAGRDIQFKRKDGSLLDIRLSPRKLKIADKNYLVIVAKDITGTKRAEEALRASESLLNSIVDQSPNPIVISDNKGNLIRINKACLDLLHIERDEVIGKYNVLLDNIVKEQGILPLVKSVFDEKKTVNFELRYDTSQQKHVELKRKTFVILDVTISPVINADGVMTNALIQHIDITMRKQVEEALRESEERYRTMIDSSNDLIQSVTPDGHFIFVNPNWRNILGYSREDVSRLNLFDIIHPDSKPHCRELFKKILSGASIPHLEVTFVAKDGRSVLLEGNAAPRLKSGEVVATQAFFHDVTEHRQMEKTLQLSEEKYRRIFENVQDVYYETSLDGAVIEISPSIEYATKGQFHREDLIGKSMFDFYADVKDRDAFLSAIQETNRVTDFEVRFRNKDGSQVYCSVSSKISYNAQGRPEKIIGSARDISERKRAEQLLEKEREELKLLIDTAPLLIFYKNNEGKFIRVNKAFAETLGMKEEDFAGKTAFDLYSGEIAKAMTNNDIEVIKSNRPKLNVIEKYESANGIRWAQTDRIPINDKNNKPIGLIGIAQDITEKRKADEELRLQSAALNAAANAILISDDKGTINWINQSFTILTGYEPEEAVGKNFIELVRSKEQDEAFYEQLWNTIVAGKTWYGEIANRRKDNTLYTEEQTITPLMDASGHIQYFIAIKQDITKRKALEDQMRQMQKMEELGTLAGGIAHDFNNILGIILAYTTNIKKVKNDDGKLNLTVNTVEKAVQRGKTLVQQILTFARKTETKFGPVNINDIVMEIMTMILETFPKVLTYTQNFEKGIPIINADRSQLHQALLNLCVNARDAMPNGGVLTINTRLVSGMDLNSKHPDAAAGSYVCVEVQDNGIGMTEEVRRRIFEPFFTTKELGKGTGLGLAVVFGIIQAHKGFIDIESTPGKGTAFRLFLPVIVMTEPVIIKDAESIEEISGGTETILVAEDEEALSASLEIMLIDKGYTVLIANDGFEALEIYKEKMKDISIVLTDLGLPKTTGLEVCRQIRQINPDERLILATGYLAPEMKEDLLKAGIQYFLYKPYEMKDVLKVVREALDKK